MEALPDGQLCCVLAMEEAGRDLEAYRLSGYHQARSVLLQVSGSAPEGPTGRCAAVPK